MSTAALEQPNVTVSRDDAARAAQLVDRIKRAQEAMVVDVAKLIADVEAHPRYNRHVLELEWLAATAETIAECARLAASRIGH
jgi:hypothetical protein